MAVFVLGKDGKPLMPCSEKRARLLLDKNRAVVKRVKPFVIQLKDRDQTNCELQNLEVKIDPGSKFTGICLSRTENRVVNVLNLFELEHRGQLISRKLKARAAMRRSRRNRNTRYREARFLNRTKPKGWLAPSLMHRVETTMSWINRLIRWSPVELLALERVKFDMQKMQNSDIQGTEYQQGTLFEKEVMEYLLEKWNHKCMYCGIEDVPFEKEHLIPRSRGGSNRISNLGLSCRKCNQAKSNLTLEEFLVNKPELLKKIKASLKRPLKDAAAVNATRNKLLVEMLKTGLPVETGTGAQTKYNRKMYSVPKTHALDAACVGDICGVNNWGIPHLGIKCTGRGSYSRTRLDKYGFPRIYFPKEKRVFGFQTGDIVKAIIKTKNTFKTIIGKIAVRTSGYFALVKEKDVFSVKWHNCKIIQRADGYQYYNKQYSFYSVGNNLLTVGQL